MEIFIVRPFGKKMLTRRDKNTGKLIEEVHHDFDRVEKELISPALKKLEITGGTTGKIFESGDIREDMFSLLLSSDIVIADITIHNANVFYELGIRHALRDKKTILIRCPGFDDTPFDILGYRYVDYEKDNPSAALPLLTAAIKETKLSKRVDSPVFNMLPKLVAQDPEKLVASPMVPSDFTEEAEIAGRSNQRGMLSLLAAEAESFPWEIPALRIIGEMLFRMKAFENCRTVWEKILKHSSDDFDANIHLATIYQRLAENEMPSNPEEGEKFLIKSDIAIEKLLDTISSGENRNRAEALSLKGRNEKTRWLQSWRKLPAYDWSVGAVKSASLLKAFEFYQKAYYEDLNHFYPGINALGLLTVIINLAKANPRVWELLYETSEHADKKLKELQENHKNLASCIKVSIDANKKKLSESDKTGVNPFHIDSTIRQLKIYEHLNVVPENIKATLAALPDAQPSVMEEQLHYLLFTGHMIDKPGRKEPRFPANKEVTVSQKIKKEIERVRSKTEGKILGIAGGACGGDIIFHEICQEAGIATGFYLALPREQFLAESVEFAGPGWVERFDLLYKKIPTHILSQAKELPGWLQKKEKYTIWERNNLWELHCALAEGGINMTLLALWDGKGGDGPGGTADMVKEAKMRGAKTIIIDPTDC